MQGSPDKKLLRCVTRFLPKFLARFWQDRARQSRQEIAKMCYKILAKSFLQDFGKIAQGSPDKKLLRCVTRFLPKFLARFWQDRARQSRQEIAKMCYKILAKSFLQDFGKIVQGSPDKKLPRCVTRFLPSFLQD